MIHHHPTRRHFLAASAASATSLAASPLVATSLAIGSSSTGLKLKKAVKFHMIQERLSILDKFKLLRDLGFQGTEIHVRLKVDIKEVLHAVDQTGVVVHGFLNSSNPDLKHAIDQAKALGATSVLVVAGRVDKEHPYDVVYREQQARIRKDAPYAEQQGIRLLVENVWNNFLLSPLEMARFIDEIGSPAVGTYFDVGNVVRFGWPEHWIRILGKRIGKLDIKEYSRKIQINEGLRKGFGVKLGEGDCDWPSVRKALHDIGFVDGWATAEVKGGNRERLADISRRMDRILAIGKSPS